ncbi:type III-B CRISPR module-associated Cmr3 family protein [Streptomyces sp. NPDC001680]
MPEVTLQLAQPAALGRTPRGTAPIDTHRHVPGSVLRGALAAAWIRDYGPPQHAPLARREEFLHLFEGPVRYGPLFDPASDVVPLSVLRCKYQPEDACRTFHTDLAATPEKPADTTGARPRCTVCGGRTQPGRGEVEYFGADPAISQVTRVQLTEGERAADGQLFTRRTLNHRVGGEAARELSGRITAPDSKRATWLLAARRLHIGGRRSTSGAAEYTAYDAPLTPPDQAQLITGGLLVVRLTSPALLVDAAGRPTDRPDETLLTELLGVPARVADAWTRREQVGGWHALTNLPKPVELAVSAGSVYRLAFPAASPGRDGLARLATHGLGLRRAEGFGWAELGAWTPPRVAQALRTPEREDMGSGIARMLDEKTGQAAWFLDRLRGCLLDRRRGREPDLAFLDLRRAEVLDDKLRRYVRILAAGDPAMLEKAVVHLEARVRKERQR